MARYRATSFASSDAITIFVLFAFIQIVHGLQSEGLEQFSSREKVLGQNRLSDSFRFLEEKELNEEKIENEEIVKELEETLLENDEYDYDEEEEVINNCCTRQKKMVLIGVDDTGDEVFVDIGQCRHACGRHARKHRPGGKRRSQTDILMQESLLPCGSEGTCEAISTMDETYHLLQGSRTVPVVSSCACVKRPRQCERQDKHFVYFPHSPFETEVNVGMCGGLCASDLSCKPLRNRTVSIEGPNGNICVEVIEKCSCASSCYRLQRYEVYFDHVWNDSTNSSERTIKKIDVGRCVGECTGGSQRHCVLRDTTNSSICLMSLTKRQTKCVPFDFTIHRLSPKIGQEITVPAVTKCGCD